MRYVILPAGREPFAVEADTDLPYSERATVIGGAMRTEMLGGDGVLVMRATAHVPDGKVNVAATRLAREQRVIGQQDVIYGPAIVAGDEHGTYVTVPTRLLTALGVE